MTGLTRLTETAGGVRPEMSKDAGVSAVTWVRPGITSRHRTRDSPTTARPPLALQKAVKKKE